MPLPFYIYSDTPAANLYELGDGRFQLIEVGKVKPFEVSSIGPFLFGRGYLLVEQALADYLKDSGINRVSYEDAVLFDRLAGTEFRTHVRIKVGQLFKSDQIKDLDLSGPRILTLGDDYYFVSPELKLMLESSQFNYLRFSEGMKEFVGKPS